MKRKLLLKNVFYIGYILCTFYSFFNLLAVILYEFANYEKYSSFIHLVLGIDVYSWPLYGVFSLAVVFALAYVREFEILSKSKAMFLFISHLIFVIIGFVCIFIIFENSF